jgi:hypothetical protein
VRRTRLAFSLLAPILLPHHLLAQTTVRPGATAAFLDHRVDAGSGLERSSGVVFGAEVRVGLKRRLTLSAAGSAGQLDARGGDAIDRDVAQLSLGAEVQALAWLALDAGFTRRSYTTVLARQRWSIGRLGAEARIPFSGGRTHAVVRAGLYPVASVNGLPRADLAFESAAGLTYRTGAWDFDLRYSLERCDFPTDTGSERIEQLSGVVLRVGWTAAR